MRRTLFQVTTTIFFLFATLKLSLIFAPQAQAAPSLSVSLQTGEKNAIYSGGSYSPTATVSTNQEVIFAVTITNTGDITASGVVLKLAYPLSYGTSHQVSATASQTSGSSAISTANINISDAPGRLTRINDTTFITWNTGSTTITNGVAANTIDTLGINFGDLIPASAYSIRVTTQANIAKLDPQTLTPTPTITQPSSPSSSSSSNTSSSSPSSGCGNTSPGNTTLTSATKTSPSTVKLSWTKAEDATSYNIRYGTSSGKYQYGAEVGNALLYEVGALKPNQTYYFQVAPVNNCMAGNWSNEARSNLLLTTETEASSQVQGASSEVTPTPTPAILGETVKVQQPPSQESKQKFTPQEEEKSTLILTKVKDALSNRFVLGAVILAFILLTAQVLRRKEKRPSLFVDTRNETKEVLPHE